MSISHETLANDIELITVQGRLDQTLNPALESQLNQLLADHRYCLIIDLTAVTYINSGGLRCLISAWRQVKQNNGNIMLYGLNERLHEIFDMIGFYNVFQIHQTRNETIAAMQAL